jgi:arylformamidase
MEIIDITQTLEKDMLTYPSVKEFNLKLIRDYKKGDHMSLSEFSMSSHLGTHVDSPYHFINNGDKITDINLSTFYGDCQVIEIPQNKKNISKDFLENISIKSRRLLFKTANSYSFNDEFNNDYVYISKEAAIYLTEKDVVLVGLDYMCVDKYKDPDRSTHIALLSSGILILESIILKNVAPGEYILNCFPLPIKDAEAAPCRATLIKRI